MKKVFKLSILFTVALTSVFVASCAKSENNEEPLPTEQIIFNGNTIGNGNQEFEIKGKHVISKGTYILKGWVYITAGAQLTIEPGTIIKGDKDTKAALIVEMGGKLIAQGTSTEPIVFTSNQAKGSRKPGDWGGLIICGKAVNNKTTMIIEGGPRSSHGGTDNADNSGVISYVRVEFAGYPFRADQEINGITLGSVGSGTKFDHVQVSYSNDDSYEWFGGAVNAKYLVAYHGWDDDFDSDNGFAGSVQYALGVRNPKLADVSVSNGFESDNNAEGSTTAPMTSAVFSNVTLVGPIGQDGAFVNNSTYIDGGAMNPNNGSKLGQFHSAIQIRRSSRLSIFNSVAVGYPIGLIIENDKGSATQTGATNENMKIKNVVFGGLTILGSDKNKSFLDQYSVNSTDLDATKESFSSTYFKRATGGNTNYSLLTDIKLAQPNSTIASPNFGPIAGSPLTGKTGLFTDALVSGAFFDKVDFIGAFKSNSDADNWTKGWTNFDPQNANY